MELLQLIIAGLICGSVVWLVAFTDKGLYSAQNFSQSVKE